MNFEKRLIFNVLKKYGHDVMHFQYSLIGARTIYLESWINLSNIYIQSNNQNYIISIKSKISNVFKKKKLIVNIQWNIQVPTFY